MLALVMQSSCVRTNKSSKIFKYLDAAEQCEFVKVNCITDDVEEANE